MALFVTIESVFPLTMEFDLDRLSPEDRREVNPPIEAESATWSAAGTLDWWVKERQAVVRSCARSRRSSEMDQGC